MSAIRVARGATGRDDIVKFDGCYHGHADSLLVKAGSGARPLHPRQPGVPAALAAQTITVPFNDLDAVAAGFAASGRVAAVIVEPVAGNMGVVPPRPGSSPGCAPVHPPRRALDLRRGHHGFPRGVRRRPGAGVWPTSRALVRSSGEGCRSAPTAGAPTSCKVAPLGGVYQAGTLSGNPLAVAAGLATLRALREDPGAYDRLERLAALEGGFRAPPTRPGCPSRSTAWGRC